MNRPDTVTFRIPDGDRQWLDQESQRLGIPATQVILKALRTYRDRPVFPESVMLALLDKVLGGKLKALDAALSDVLVSLEENRATLEVLRDAK